MSIKTYNIFLLSIFRTLLFSEIIYTFIIDHDCLYKEEGVPFSFDVSPPQIEFYILHNWANNEDNLNHLNIKLFNINLVLRHPLSTKKESNDVYLPLNEMNIGWNTIYLNKTGRTVQVETVNRNLTKVIQNITLPKGVPLNFDEKYFKDPFYVSGLYSLVNCLKKDNPSTYYKIRAKSNFTVPFTLTREHNNFIVFSESSPFTFELFSSGHKLKVCKNNKKSIYSFTIKRQCEGAEVANVSEFPENKTHNMHVSTSVFDLQDVTRYYNSYFTQFVIHNTGDTDFYIQIDILPLKYPPIHFLKGYFSKDKIPNKIPGNESTPTDEESTSVIASTNKVWIIIASVFGVLFVLLIVAFVLLYLKYYFTRLCIQNHSARVDNDFFPFPEGFQGYVVESAPQEGFQGFVESTAPQVGIPPRVSNSPVEASDENYYEEYHYYEKYHPKVNEEAKPQYENDFQGKN